MRKSYGAQTITCSPTSNDPSTFELRLANLDGAQLGDLAWQIENKLLEDADEFETSYRSLLRQIRESLEGGKEPYDLTLRILPREARDLARKFRDRLTSQTTIKYRELYLEMSSEMQLAWDRHFRRGK